MSDWQHRSLVTVEHVEVCELTAPYAAHSIHGLQEGSTGDFLIRPAGSENRKEWRVIPAADAHQLAAPVPTDVDPTPASGAEEEPPRKPRTRKPSGKAGA